jgi:hypothetical protein
MRVFHQHFAGCDSMRWNAPTGVAQQDDVAGRAVDREVLIERGDLHVLRLQHHGEERRVRNRAAIGNGDAA